MKNIQNKMMRNMQKNMQNSDGDGDGDSGSGTSWGDEHPCANLIFVLQRL
jgi:hypothetical protein